MLCLLYTNQLNSRPYVKYGTKVFGAFLDSSKAFDKLLHNSSLIKLLDKNVPISFVLL